MRNKVSIISVNFNGYALTCAMLDSLRKHNTYPVEIIIVDNGSKVDESLPLKQAYPEIISIRSDKNLGFAGGNNLGIKAATGDLLYFINNDTEIEEDCIGKLVEAFDRHPDAGMICPKIRFFQQPRHIQFAGYTPFSSVTLRNSLIGFDCPDDGSFDTAHESPYAHGAAMMVRKKAIDQCGGIPECYFLYYEELDWSQRIRDKGWTIWYDPCSTIFHKESASTGKDSPLKRYYLTRNRLVFACRNLHGLNKELSVLFQICISAPVRIARCLKDGRKDLADAVIRGIKDFRKARKAGQIWF